MSVSGAIFGVFGLFKIISAFGSAKILLAHDPIFGVPNHDLFIMIGVLELLAAWMLVGPRPIRWKLVLIAALSTNFLIYRAGLRWLGITGCPCLGNPAAWTHLAPNTLDWLTKGALIWLLVSSYGFLIMMWHQKKPRALTPTGARPWAHA